MGSEKLCPGESCSFKTSSLSSTKRWIIFLIIFCILLISSLFKWTAFWGGHISNFHFASTLFISPMLLHYCCSRIYIPFTLFEGFPGVSVVKSLPVSVGDAGLVSGYGRSPGEGNGNPLQYSCLGNPVDRGALWALTK